MLPGRLGLRFALEALFLVLLAIGAGLADLRPGFIVLVMAVAWLLVAIVEFTAERIAASPLTYLLPQRPEAPVDEEDARWPMPEERTIVAPLEQSAPEPEPSAPPRHVKLLPRRSAPEDTRAAQDVAEIFDEPGDPEEQSG